MVAWWLAVGSVENVEVALEHGVWGLRDSFKLIKVWRRISPGDYVFFYVTRPISGVVGYGVVVEKFRGKHLLWPQELKEGRVIWPNRFRFKIEFSLPRKMWSSHRYTSNNLKRMAVSGFQSIDRVMASEIISKLVSKKVRFTEKFIEDVKPVIVLYTHWNGKFWEKSKRAPYPGLNYKSLSDWDKLKKMLPLPGIGVYTRGKVKGRIVDYRDMPIVYLCVKNMLYDERESPIFIINPIKVGTVKSRRFLSKVGHYNFIEVRSFKEVEAILSSIGEKPPWTWIKIAKKLEVKNWRDWIGMHFLKLEDKYISDKEFEDIVADLFRALGFRVKQLGYKERGANPDGYVVAPYPYSFAIVYDCKNREDYYPTESDIRALKEYVREWRPRIRDRHRDVNKVLSCFIAKSFKAKRGADIFLESKTLLQFLYEKLRKGLEFTLDSVIY